MTWLWLDDSNSFLFPLYTIESFNSDPSSYYLNIDKKDKTLFPLLLIQILIYYYGHINQIIKEKKESRIELTGFESYCKNFNINNSRKLLKEIIKKDKNLTEINNSSKEIFYKINDFSLPSIRIPKMLKTKISLTGKIMNRMRFDPNRTLPLIILCKALEANYSIYNNWNLENTILENNILNSFSVELRRNVNTYINHFKNINLFEGVKGGGIKFKFDIKGAYSWPFISETYRDKASFEISKDVARLLNIDCLNTVYDVITRLRGHIFHLNEKRTGRFLINLPGKLAIDFGPGELADGKGKISELFDHKFVIINRRGNISYRIGKNKFNSENIINPKLKNDLSIYYDYRGGRLINKFTLKEDNPLSYCIALILQENNKCKIISSSSGGIKIRFKNPVNKNTVYLLKEKGLYYDITKNTLEIPPSDLYHIIERLYKRRSKTSTSSKIMRDYRSKETFRRRAGYFFGFLKEYINHLYKNWSSSEKNTLEIEPNYEYFSLALSKFEFIKDKRIYRNFKDTKLNKKLSQFYKNLSNDKFLLDFYFAITLLTKEKNIIPEGTPVKLEINEPLIIDCDERHLVYSGDKKSILFKYTKNMPGVLTDNDWTYQEHTGWVRLDKEIIKNKLPLILKCTIENEKGKIENRDSIDIKIRLDFYMNYFKINGAMEKFKDFWKDYLKSLEELENYFSSDFW